MAEVGDVLPFGEHEITMTVCNDAFSIGTLVLQADSHTTLMENTVSKTKVAVISGSISFYAAGRIHDLGPGQGAGVDARMPHHFTANEDDTKLSLCHRPPYNPDNMYKVGWRRTETVKTGNYL